MYTLKVNRSNKVMIQALHGNDGEGELGVHVE
jgi:hypothetical protein